jgi:hypothetical protein
MNVNGLSFLTNEIAVKSYPTSSGPALEGITAFGSTTLILSFILIKLNET